MSLDPAIVAIEEALRAANKPRAEIGRLLGLDSTQVWRLFNGKRRLQRHEHQRIMEWLGIAEPSPAVASTGAVLPMPGMVPLFGWVGAASHGRLTMADQNLRGYVPMHPNQAHVRGAFALEVADVSMSPRYEPGEIVYLAANRFPSKGQDCVVVTTDGEGLLKRFLGRDSEKLHLDQLNPARDLDFGLDQVEAVHAVVGRG